MSDDKLGFDIHKFVAHLTIESAKDVAGGVRRWWRKNRLSKALKRDFEELLLPEEVELDLLQKNVEYPLLIMSRSEIPKTLKRTVSILDFTTELGLEMQRVIYHVAVLIDNFLPEAKSLLPLDASLGLVFAQVEIRALRNYEEKLLQLLRTITSREGIKPEARNFLDEKVVNWENVIKWKETFYMLFEAGVFFSIIIPKIKEMFKHCNGKPCKEHTEELLDFIQNLHLIETSLRKGKVDKKYLVWEGKILGKIGFILVRPPPEIPALLDENHELGCQEITILSRGFGNVMWSLQGTIEGWKNFFERGIDYGIKSIKLEESYLYKEGIWATAVRICLCRGHCKLYQNKIKEMLQSRAPIISVKSPSLTLGTSIQEIRSMERKLRKKRYVIVTNDTDTFKSTCVIEAIRTLRGMVRFTEDITITNGPEYSYLKALALLNLVTHKR